MLLTCVFVNNCACVSRKYTYITTVYQNKSLIELRNTCDCVNYSIDIGRVINNNV